MVASGYASRIGECVAMTNWLFAFISSCMETRNESCRCGDNAASGSSRTIEAVAREPVRTRARNDSPCDCSWSDFPP